MKKKSIEDIEDALTPHDAAWAVEQMKLGHTVNRNTDSSSAQWKLVNGELLVQYRPEDKWFKWNGALVEGSEYSWVMAHGLDSSVTYEILKKKH